VVTHAKALLAIDDSTTAVIQSDIRDAGKIFADRSRADILRFFDGFELVEPGLTHVTRWRGDDLDEQMQAAGQWWLDGVGRKTGS
jgi:hypothetical protein